jgi:hypothetical protein
MAPVAGTSTSSAPPFNLSRRTYEKTWRSPQPKLMAHQKQRGCCYLVGGWAVDFHLLEDLQGQLVGTLEFVVERRQLRVLGDHLGANFVCVEKFVQHELLRHQLDVRGVGVGSQQSLRTVRDQVAWMGVKSASA